ncbi:MAG TPA: hypothetical protein VGM03_12130 [Phycisphaerae bacterium]
MARFPLAGIASMLACLIAPLANAEVLVSIATPNGSPESGFQAGDVLTLPVTAQGESIAGLCAIDFDLTCNDCNSLQIVSVAFHPAFSLVIPGGSTPLPGSAYHTCRARPPEAAGASLAEAGSAVQLATVTLQVLSDQPGPIPLTVHVKAATGTRDKPPTLVQAIDSSGNTTPPQSEEAQVVIGPPSGSDQPPPAVPPPPQSATVTLEVRDSAGTVVTTLAAGQAYALHYTADANLNGYALGVISDSPESVLGGAQSPAGEPWSGADHFTSLDLCGTVGQPIPAPEYGEGLYLCDTVTGELSGSGAAEAQLLTFTPQATGELLLHVNFWQADESGAHTAEGQAEIALAVE